VALASLVPALLRIKNSSAKSQEVSPNGKNRSGDLGYRLEDFIIF
jgi:hypothetical protein